MNPYTGTGLLSFFGVLLQRAGSYVAGHPMTLASDEVQLIVLSAVGLACGWLGPLLVLRRMTMLANSLSHTILIGIVGAYLVGRHLLGLDPSTLGLPMGLLLPAAALTGILTAAATQGLTRMFRLPEETSTGLVFTSLFALGVILVSLFTRNAHIGLEIVMGNADGLSVQDIHISLAVIGIHALLLPLCARAYMVTSFDTGFARLLGFPTGLYAQLLMVQTAISVVAGFRAVGVLMVLSLLTGPAIAVRPWIRNLPQFILWSGAVGALCTAMGVATSRALLSWWGLSLATGPVCVVWVTAAAVLSLAWQAWQQRCCPRQGVTAIAGS